MKLDEIIRKRRSIRIFNGDKIDKANIDQILEAGIWAPTGCNNQEIKFIVLGEDKALAEGLKFKSFFRGASHFVLVMCDMSIPLSKKMYKRGSSAEMMSDLDAGLAIQNMVLKAQELVIDSCIVNLSPQHYKNEKGLSLMAKFSKELKRFLGFHASNPNSFEYFLRDYLEIPSHYKIRAGIVLGYGKNYPDLSKARHGKNMLKRRELSEYVITDKYAE